jgi:ferredoxin
LYIIKGGKMATASVNAKLCIGCGACASICSEVFEMRNGKSVVKKSKVDDVSCAKEAESGCPVGAITVK